jgi:hypothetical protein
MASVSGGDKLAKVLADIGNKIQGKKLKVGFLSGATYPDGTPVSQVAFWNEFGTDAIPTRPFFRSMIAKHSGTWGGQLAKAMSHYNEDADKALGLMGEAIKGQLQDEIVQFSTPANAPSTIAAKGFNDPLIDTGHMRDSVDYVVGGDGD